MGSNLEVVRYSCDWINEFEHECEYAENFASRTHQAVATEAGWGAYTNAYIRRSRWTTGAEAWFCPVHATVFRNNHGWGGLEDYTPPKKWWKSFHWSKP